ncbi:MAG: histidinol-phosphatase [Deltaproteobacteria bacterium]|nr:MAG: histidinol-phosphatase [Deltaproteobacteria bacterium]
MRKVALIDRDGTIIIEPEDFQIDSLAKLELVPGVIPALLDIQSRGYELVMVTNQDYLGSDGYPLESFELVQDKLMSLLESQGISFSKILICPHGPDEGCSCRKPDLGLFDFQFLQELDRKNSFVVGDRITDQEMANKLGVSSYLLNDSLKWSDIIIQQFNQIISKRFRRTNETEISLKLSQVEEKNVISTGIGYFDHMLDSLIKNSGMSLTLKAEGDLYVDQHHLVEDVGIVLGQAFRDLIDRNVLRQRYSVGLPMDESITYCLLDIGGRYSFSFEDEFSVPMIGELPTEMIQHFFNSLAENAKWTLSMNVKGKNNHHMAESAFKALGRSLREAFQEVRSISSTKGFI